MPRKRAPYRSGLLLLGTFLVLIAAVPDPARAVDCARSVRADAESLLRFHRGDDDRIYIEPKVTSLGGQSNPAAPNETFQHYEVWGHIYKGRYRMRFQYAELTDDCVLMGQEIMEFAVLGYGTGDSNPEQGIVRALTMGDRACYLQLETGDGQTVDHLADFELCERGELIGRSVQLLFEFVPIADARCEGDPECPDTVRARLVVDALAVE